MNIYTDKISEFSLLVNEKSKGLVTKRLESIYDMIFIDEVQDLAGYDFDLLEFLLKSKVAITLVGDSRQATYFTNLSPKNKKLRGKNIVYLFKEWEKQKLCSIVERNECFRCNQNICDFADKLYPLMTKTVSMNTAVTGHDGVFVIEKSKVADYISIFKPQVLTYRKSNETQDLRAINFGMSKGLSFDRVLIFPTKKFEDYLKTENVSKIGDIPKVYVAITRARFSVAIVYDGNVKSTQISKYQ
jgi:DNA helicase-2/ATP-dependent DNA helicase PcrA